MLGDLISSITCQTSGIFSLTVVDLTEEDVRQPVPWLRKIEDRVTYLTGENKGYAHGVNIGISHAIKRGDKLLAIINPDVVLDPDFILHATHTLASHPRTIIGGKILYAPGFEYHTKSPAQSHIPYTTSPGTHYIWYAGGAFDWAHATSSHRGVDELDSAQYDSAEPTQFVTGCCMIYDRTVHDIVGEWDARYFMYYEDADYCVRASKIGIRIWYDPSIILWHKNAQSTGGSGSPLHTISMARSRLRFGLKYAPLRTRLHLIKDYVFSKI